MPLSTGALAVLTLVLASISAIACDGSDGGAGTGRGSGTPQAFVPTATSAPPQPTQAPTSMPATAQAPTAAPATVVPATAVPPTQAPPTSPPAPAAPTPAPMQPPAPPPSGGPPPPAVRIEVVAIMELFDRVEIRVRSGAQVTAVLRNLETGVDHNLSFSVAGLDHGDTCPGPCTRTQVFMAPTPGRYNFFCTIHSTMVGDFIVDP